MYIFVCACVCVWSIKMHTTKHTYIAIMART